ncbi:folate family ECF transporter S component [Aerococcaceae bacterium WGS1372]
MDSKLEQQDSLRTRKISTSQLTLMSIMIAARIILSFIPTLNVNNLIEVGFGFVGAAFSGILFGPIYALIVSVINDLITFFIGGGGIFFPGFTLSAAVGGWIYGQILWRKPISWKRIFVAVLLVTLIVNIGMNSIWIKMLFGQAWMAFMPLRIGKNLVTLPLNTLILVVLFTNPSIKKLIEKYQF